MNRMFKDHISLIIRSIIWRNFIPATKLLEIHIRKNFNPTNNDRISITIQPEEKKSLAIFTKTQ